MVEKHKNKKEIAAVIKISSDVVYLCIAETKENGIKILEYLEHPFSIAQDAYTSGKIGAEKVEKVCAILNNYRKLIQEYGITKVKTYATTAFREAANASFIIDQIKTRTHLDTIVLDDCEEKTYIYKQMTYQMEQSPQINNSNVFMAYIGSGSLGIAVYSKGNILFSQNIRIGTMKLLEILGDLKNDQQHFYTVIQEYLSSFKHAIRKMLPIDHFDYFIACGKEIQAVAQICKAEENDGLWFFSKEAFTTLSEELKFKSPKQIGKLFPIPEIRTQFMLPFMGIYQMLLEIIQVESIGVVPSGLLESLLFEMLHQKEALKRAKKFDAHTILYAKNLGRRFFYEEEHAIKVEEYAVAIFDATKKIHHLSHRHRFLLQIAALLHDIGKYIHLKYHALHSYQIIRDSEILGLSTKELMIVANLARFHTHIVNDFYQTDFGGLTKEDGVILSKLLAILRIADALDRSHEQKGTKIEVRLKKDTVKIFLHTSSQIFLEKWIFDKKSDFFSEVFGLPILLKRGDSHES